MAPRIVVPVDKGWSFKQVDLDDTQWLPVGQFPTMVHLDLLAHDRIPDPFVGKNEELVQWIGEKQWVYKTTFEAPAVSAASQKTVLAFDGLDTFATVVLNGTTILESDNMFLPYRVDVSSVVRPAETNELVITFDSAYLRGWDLVEKYPDHKWGCWNGDNSRLAVRKSQYHWVGYHSPLPPLPSSFSFPFLSMLIVANCSGLGLGPGANDLRTMATHKHRGLRGANHRPVV